MRARTFDAEQELSARPVNPSLGPSSFIDVAPSSTVVQELLARAPDSHCQLCPSQLEISLKEFYFRYLARGEVGGLWSHRFLPLRERALHCYYISGVAAARVMASCCASQCGSLGSTLASQAFVGKRSAGFRREYVSLPSSKARMTGSTVGQLQKARCSPFQKSNGYGRREPSHVTCIAVSEEIAVEKEEETIPEVEEKSSSLTPYTFEVHQLLMELCDETSIAELQLKVGSFKLSVKRNVGKIKGATVAPPVAPPPVPSKPMVDSLPSAPAPPASTPITSAASGLISSLSKPLSSTWALLESAADEGLLFVKSPKVGYFRKGRVAKGKSGPPLVEEGQVIKEGHVVCYLEQLGTQQPVESNIGGEVVKVLWDDGEPVGYGDPLIAIRPSFPGIKKLT